MFEIHGLTKQRLRHLLVQMQNEITVFFLEKLFHTKAFLSILIRKSIHQSLISMHALNIICLCQLVASFCVNVFSLKKIPNILPNTKTVFVRFKRNFVSHDMIFGRKQIPLAKRKDKKLNNDS